MAERKSNPVWRVLTEAEIKALSPQTRFAYKNWLKRKRRTARKKAATVAVNPAKTIPAFYDTPEWKRIRYEALKRSNGHCECCGAGPEHGARLNVDHIKPRQRYPELALELSNLQVLCAWCNEGKGGWDRTDWRKKPVSVDEALDLSAIADLREKGLLN